ncbi:319L [Invertebrate iridescent virus Kaz2018]|uniref:319L n=1 Tax=Invertebrate iridescent virus 6 TaxID=176652 RepID=Q91FK5_IIV6|nr:319L [Invertebrate iridescent virus 6]AAK82180.1 319L [Invertebrate iridescent virus 6]QNH08729.1 319L [Invertebrate iridescent virus Kaz2018]
MVKLLILDIQLMICLHLLLMFCIQVVKFIKFYLNHKCLFFQVYLLHLQLILHLIFYMLVLMDHLMSGTVLYIIMFL